MPKGLSKRAKQENREMIGFYRDWMNRVRTKDLIKNLGDLEAYARKRADLLTHYCKPHPLLSEHSVKVFQAIEAQERNLVEQFAFMREKLGWVLSDMNEAGGITASTESKPPPPPPAPPKSPSPLSPLPPMESAGALLARFRSRRINPPDQPLVAGKEN